jgi:hypothetical protein
MKLHHKAAVKFHSAKSDAEHASFFLFCKRVTLIKPPARINHIVQRAILIFAFHVTNVTRGTDTERKIRLGDSKSVRELVGD